MESEILPLLDGLLYPSESDEPVVYVCVPHASDGGLSAGDLGTLFSIDPASPVAEHDPSRFWATVTAPQEWHDDYERDRTRRFVQLREILERNLGNIQYFEVGKTEVLLFLIGQCGQTIQGVQTMAVRT